MKGIFLTSLGFPFQRCCINSPRLPEFWRWHIIMFVVRFNSLLSMLVFGSVDVGDDPDQLGFPLQLCCIKCSPTLTGMLVIACFCMI